MISLDEATRLVLQHAHALDAVNVPLCDALGRTLAETVTADRDLPPFHKVLMDGYAVRADDLPAGTGVLDVVGTVAAGQLADTQVGPGQAVKVMTGGMLPAGADAVVMVERTEPRPGGKVHIAAAGLAAGQYLMRRGDEMRCGQVLLEPGHTIRAAECGLLGMVGRTDVQVRRRPQLAVVCTGTEVVEPDATPTGAQIRNANGPTLVALADGAGCETRYLGIARDDEAELRRRLSEGLDGDVLIVSGGVSAGDLDLVPHVLARLGVEPVFHKVAVKPGKPIWFGTRGGTLVFGLPGNPVSVIVGFELLVRPTIRKLTGRPDPGPVYQQAVLAVDHHLKADRPTFYPVTVVSREGRLWATPLAWRGSPDLRAVTAADGFLLFPAGNRLHRNGTEFDLLQLG